MTNNVEGPSPSQQKKLLGSTIIFGSRSLKACGQSVPIKSVEVHQVAGVDFLANTRVPFGEVGIATPCITEMVVNNRQSGRCFDFWQRRYYDFNVFRQPKHVEKLRYMHRNPVKRGLVKSPELWPWSSFARTGWEKKGRLRSGLNRSHPLLPAHARANNRATVGPRKG
jgi:hypothetical protein